MQKREENQVVVFLHYFKYTFLFSYQSLFIQNNIILSIPPFKKIKSNVIPFFNELSLIEINQFNKILKCLLCKEVAVSCWMNQLNKWKILLTNWVFKIQSKVNPNYLHKALDSD